MNKTETETSMVVNAYVPVDIVRLIDRSAKYEGISRSAFIRRATMKEIRKMEMNDNPGNAAKLNPGPVTSQPEESKPHEDCTKY